MAARTKTGAPKFGPLTFEYDGDTVELKDDTDRWTVAEMRAIERVLGSRVEDFGMLDQTTAVILVSVKRMRPSTSLQDILDSLDMAIIGEVLEAQRKLAEEEDAADPTQLADAGEPSNETPESDS